VRTRAKFERPKEGKEKKKKREKKKPSPSAAVFEKYLADHVKPIRKAADIELEMSTDLLSRWKD